MKKRGASREEVVCAILHGEEVPARAPRTAYRLNFPFGALWGNRFYGTKQVAPIVEEKKDRRIVVTVYVFYF